METYWKEWAARKDIEELKDGILFELGLGGESFIDVVYDGFQEGSWRNMVADPRQFVAAQSPKAMVSVKQLDQHRVVKEVGGSSRMNSH